MTNARVNQIDVSQVLVEDYKVPKEEIGKALAAFFNTPFWEPAGRTLPADLKERLTPEFLKRNMCAPIEKREGTLLVGVEDPYDLTRLDAIKAMNLAPRYDFVVALKPDILEYINTSYGLTSGGGSEAADLGRIITELGSGEEDEVAAEEADPGAPPELDETDSGIVKLANQIIIDAYNKGASDIHVEPYGKTGTARSTWRSPPPIATRSSSASRSWPSWTSRRSASPRTERSGSRGPWARWSCAWPRSPPRAATRTS